MDFENFNEIPQLEKEKQTQTVTETNIEVKFDNLPRLEDLLKSENEVTPIQAPTIKGLKQVEPGRQSVEKTFARKEDEKRAFVKRRVKILTSVYISVITLLLGFVGVNTATLIHKGILSNTVTQNIEVATANLTNAGNVAQEDIIGGVELTVNTPRDYGDDNTKLSFFDRVTILFRSLFG